MPGKHVPRRPLAETDRQVTVLDQARRAAINIFLIVNIVAIACWVIPSDSPVLKRTKDVFKPYLVWSGLFQSWDTFAPNPTAVNSNIKAVIFTRNHHVHVWAFPRMEELSLSERYRKERYRKFTEVLPAAKFATLWPDVADHLARSFKDPKDPVEKVMLIQFSSGIDIRSAQIGDPTPKSVVFYEDYVEAEGQR
jgi:hypothetical protein